MHPFKKLGTLLCIIALNPFIVAPALAQTPTKSHINPKIKINKLEAKKRTRLSRKKQFKVIYHPQPNPIPLNKHFRLKIQVQTPKNIIIKDAQIKVNATMPAHNHGMNVKPKVKRLKDGIFEVKGLLFHMPGEWEMTVDITHKGKKDRAIFIVNLGMPKVDPHASHHHHH